MRVDLDPDATEVRGERLRLAAFIALVLLAGFGLRAAAGVPTLPDHLPTLSQVTGVLGGAVLPVEAIARILVGLAWLLWLWVMASLGLELLVVAAEHAARGAAWVTGIRRVVDRVSMPFARRAVAAAFALQVVSRALPVAAAPPPSEEAWTVDAGEADPPADVRAPSSAYRVRAGDTLWSIAEGAYGSGSEYRRLVSANLGRRMIDGEVFGARGVIRPGWILDVPEPSRWIDRDEGQRWYTVEAGDTLSGIAARVLGQPDRWTELFELNRDVATLDDGRTLARPELIWPGLRLRLPDEARIALDESPHALLSAASAPPAIADPPFEVPARTVEAARPHDAQPVHYPEPTSDQPPLVREPHAVPPYEPDAASAPEVEHPGLPDEPPAPPGVPVAATAGLIGLVGMTGLAAIGVRRLRRLRPLPQEPESEVVVEGGYAEAQLTHEFARQLQGGVAFDAASAQVRQLLQLLDEFSMVGVEPVALRHGRSSTTISLAARLSDQPLLLDLAPVLAERLQAAAEAWVSNDQDVHVRLVHVRKTRLLPRDDTPKRELPWFVPLGVLYDRQVFSAAWPAVGHLLVASLPGRGADTILTSLLATVTAHRSPHELRAWIVARYRSLPAPLEQLPHLDATIDPDDAEELAGLVARLRAELDQRALGGAWPELVIVVAELTSLVECAVDLQPLLGAAACCGVRLIAATSEPLTAAQSPLLASFSTRMVLHMAAEEASVALLGTADAAYLGGGGRLLLRLDGREPVELYGYQVAPDHLERLVRVMRNGYLTPAQAQAGTAPPPLESEPVEPDPEVSPMQADGEDELAESPAAILTMAPVAKTSSVNVAEHECSVGDQAPIKVFCLGAPRVLCKGKQVWPAAAVHEAKPWELLLFIACQPTEGVARENLAQALWPDDAGDDELVVHRLRQMRYRLRHYFSAIEGGPASDGISISRQGPPHLDHAVVYSDAQEFLELTHQARVQPGRASIPVLERARELYTGDLLLGPDTRRYAWADERDDSGVTLREHFRRRLQHATYSLAELYVETEHIDSAIELYRELTDADPGEDRAWRGLFQLHANRNDLPSLMREERRLRIALRDLAVRAGDGPRSAASEPSAELKQEYQRLVATIESPRRAVSAG